MAKDPYQVLGIPKSASADEVKRAFRELAKKYHPDKTKGDKAAEVKFKEINTAYDILGDAAKRRRFDRGEIDAAGNERAYTSANDGPWAGKSSGFAGGTNFRDFNFTDNTQRGGGFSAEDIFSDLFGTRGNKNKSRGGPFDRASKGDDLPYDLAITLFEAVRGGKRRIKLPNDRTIDVAIPTGTTDGQTLRLKGLGEAGRSGGPNGDALVTLKVEKHPFFVMKGLNIHVEVPVTLYEAVLGGDIKVPTLDGPVNVKVPAGSNSGTQLRLKGKGVTPGGKNTTAGDQYCTLKVVLPEKADDDLANLVEKWAKKHQYDVRKKLL
jgi:DnaJ-class molecular chaperone